MQIHISNPANQDRACLYGDGLFETIAYRQQQIEHWADHWQRLQNGLIRLAYPPVHEADIISILMTKLTGQTEDSVIRLSISRTGERGYRLSPNADLVINIQLSPFPRNRWHNTQIQARWCQTRWARQPLLAGMKHLNRLEQIIARSEWQDTSIAEGLVCDTEGYVISGTMSGLVWRKQQSIFAADLTQTGIASTSRQRFLQQKTQEGYQTHIGYFLPSDIMQADEIWVMNAIQGIAKLSPNDII